MLQLAQNKKNIGKLFILFIVYGKKANCLTSRGPFVNKIFYCLFPEKIFLEFFTCENLKFRILYVYLHCKIISKINSNMININGVQVDPVNGINSLLNDKAVFTIEFEATNKIMVCHALYRSVYRVVKQVINDIFSVKVKSIELREALLSSKYITVNIEKQGFSSELQVLKYKYELIKRIKAYIPYGYNALTHAGNTLEQNYANLILQELIEESNDKLQNSNSLLYTELKGNPCKRGRVSKPVFSYDKLTGLPVQEFASVKEASEETGICASNISMCCNGRIKTAGPYMWSYIKQPIIDINSSAIKRAKDASIPREKELVDMQKEYIQKNASR